MLGQGRGQPVDEAAIDFAKNNAGVEIISLEVRADNTRAQALYRKYGFEEIGRFPGFFKIDGKWVDFILMNLYL